MVVKTMEINLTTFHIIIILVSFVGSWRVMGIPNWNTRSNHKYDSILGEEIFHYYITHNRCWITIHVNGCLFAKVCLYMKKIVDVTYLIARNPPKFF
jgi:hypothetical protein